MGCFWRVAASEEEAGAGSDNDAERLGGPVIEPSFTPLLHWIWASSLRVGYNHCSILQMREIWAVRGSTLLKVTQVVLSDSRASVFKHCARLPLKCRYWRSEFRKDGVEFLTYFFAFIPTTVLPISCSSYVLCIGTLWAFYPQSTSTAELRPGGNSSFNIRQAKIIGGGVVFS